MKRTGSILVVAAEASSRERLEQLFGEIGLEGELVCHSDSAEALAALSENSFKVVFAEMGEARAGVDFLQDCWKAHPQVVRFLLAPFVEEELMVECAVNAHHFLKSPLNQAELKAALERAEGMNRLVRNGRIQSLVSRMRALPSRPTLYLEVLRELRSSGASAQAVGEIVSKDLGISMKLIQVVNSAFYGLAQKVEDPSAAVLMLGLETTASLVLSIEAFSRFDKVKPLYFSSDRLWRHSQSVAHSARKIAEAMSNDLELARHAFTAGLVHDIGKLALALNFEEQYQGALKLAEKNNLSPCEVEAQVFGATHAETGAYLLSLWGLPLPIVEAVAGHHLTAAETGAKFTALTALHLSERLHFEQEQLKNGAKEVQSDLAYSADLELQGRLDEFRRIVGGRESEDNGGTMIMTRAQLKAAPLPVNMAAGNKTVAGPMLELQPVELAPRKSSHRFLIPACVTAAIALLVAGFAVTRSSATKEERMVASQAEGAGQISKLMGETPKPIASADAAAVSTERQEAGDFGSKLKLQAIIYNGSRSAMVIDGRSFRLGDEVSGARIVAVEPEEVVLEKEGAQSRLRLQ